MGIRDVQSSNPQFLKSSTDEPPRNPTTNPTRKIRGLRFCASVLNDVDATLLFRTSAVFALNTLNASRMPRRCHVVDLERPRRAQVGVPEIRIAEVIDLRRDQHVQRRIRAERRRRALTEHRIRIALAAEDVAADLDAVRRLIHGVRVELPLRVDVDVSRSAAAALRCDTVRRSSAARSSVGVGLPFVSYIPAVVSKCSRALLNEKPTWPIQRFDKPLHQRELESRGNRSSSPECSSSGTRCRRLSREPDSG